MTVVLGEEFKGRNHRGDEDHRGKQFRLARPYFAVTSPSFLSMPPISGFDMKFFHTKPVR